MNEADHICMGRQLAQYGDFVSKTFYSILVRCVHNLQKRSDSQAWSYFQCNRSISFSMDCRHYIAKAALAQKVAVLVNVLELDGLSITSNYFEDQCFNVFRWKLLYELLVCNLWLNGYNNKICFILGVRLILDLSCPDQMLRVGVNSEVNVLQGALNQASLRETAHRIWLLIVILKRFHHCSH
jgi:hypothetical protein